MDDLALRCLGIISFYDLIFFQQPDVDNWSAFICMKCIRKLRVSYEFDKMCKKSSIILHQYLTELFNCTESNCAESFVNAELKIQIEKLPQQPTQKRKYIKRERRCSLLKDLLMKIRNDRRSFEIKPPAKPRKVRNAKTSKNSNSGGGLKSLVQFTRWYNYGYKIDKDKLENVKFERTPLDKLTDFVNSYFNLSLNTFHQKIACVLEETEEWFDDYDDLEEMIKPCKEDLLLKPVKFEEVIVEPDINIKKEIITDDINDENMEFEVSYPCTSAESQIKLEQIVIKAEPGESAISSNIPSRSNAEIYPTLCESLGRQNQSSLNLLQEFTESNFNRQSKLGGCVVPRTRKGKYQLINPQLKKQFLQQDFKCSVCNRRFKSQGYLQAHCSKMKHKQ